MEERKRLFLISVFGVERTARIEEQLEELGKELAEAGISFKDLHDGATTFSGADMEQTMATFSMVVFNILHSVASPDERADMLTALAAELVQRLDISDTEVKDFLTKSVEAFAGNLADGRDAEKGISALKSRVQSVLTAGGGRKATAGPMMLMFKQPGRYDGVIKYRHTQLWNSLGLTADAVAKYTARTDGKGLGVSRVRVEQLLKGNKGERARVLKAIKIAAKKAGRTDEEITSRVAKFEEGAKEAGRQGLVNPYVADLIASKR